MFCILFSSFSFSYYFPQFNFPSYQPSFFNVWHASPYLYKQPFAQHPYISNERSKADLMAEIKKLTNEKRYEVYGALDEVTSLN